MPDISFAIIYTIFSLLVLSILGILLLPTCWPRLKSYINKFCLIVVYNLYKCCWILIAKMFSIFSKPRPLRMPAQHSYHWVTFLAIFDNTKKLHFYSWEIVVFNFVFFFLFLHWGNSNCKKNNLSSAKLLSVVWGVMSKYWVLAVLATLVFCLPLRPFIPTLISLPFSILQFCSKLPP